MPLIHLCKLPVTDYAGFPKLPPNVTWQKKWGRYFRKMFLINSNHFMSKRLFRSKSAILGERRRHAMGPYFYVIHPMSILNSVLEAIFVFVWTFSIIFEPLTIFMSHIDTTFFRHTYNYMIYPAQIIIIILFFDIGYINTKTSQVVIEPRKIIYRYVKTYFLIDLLSTGTTEKVFEFIDNDRDYALDPVYYYRRLWIIYFLRIASCCVRINTLFSFLDNTLANMRFSKYLKCIFAYVIKTYIYIHLFTFLSYFVPFFFHKGNWPKESWLYQANIKTSVTPLLTLYSECFLMTSCYFFGINYKYEIELLEEEICITVMLIFGRLYTLFLLADILRVFGIAGVSESTYEKHLALLQEYINAKNLPESLRRRMVKYYEYKFQGRYFKEEEIIGSLSEQLRMEVFLFTAKRLTEKVEIFKKLPISTIGAIIATMESETYSPKDIIIRLGSEIDNIYFISAGTVAVKNKHGVELCHLEDGDAFGTSCLLHKQQMHAIVAIETTEVFSIQKTQFMELLYPHPGAISEFFSLAKSKLAKMKILEERANKKKLDLITELESGNILDKPNKRLIAQ